MHNDFKTALDDFDTYNEAKGLSTRTRHWYTHQLQALAAFLEMRNVVPSATAGRDILAFMAQERRRGLSERSIDARFRALRAFFRWIEKSGYFDGLKNPVAPDYKPKLKRKIGKRITLEEYKKLQASISGDSWIDARDRALIAVLFRVGLRAGECAGLRVADIDLRARRLVVNGDTSKTKEDSLMPFEEETKRLLMEYLFNRPIHPTDTNVLWLSNDGAGGVREQGLTADGIYIVLKRRCAAAGLPRFGPQSFRRGFGSAMLNSGVKMSTVSALLRHSSVKVTEDAYAEWENEPLRAEYEEAQKRMR